MTGRVGLFIGAITGVYLQLIGVFLLYGYMTGVMINWQIVAIISIPLLIVTCLLYGVKG